MAKGKFKPFNASNLGGVKGNTAIKLETATTEESKAVPVETVVADQAIEEKALAPLPKTTAATEPTQQKAVTAAMTGEYSEDDSYIGLVKEILTNKTGINIFKIEAKHGPVQAYSNAIAKPEREKMMKGSQIQFTPLRNEGTNGVFFTAVNVRVLAQDPSQALLAEIIGKFQNTGSLVSTEEILEMMDPEKDVDNNIAKIEGRLKGEILGFVQGKFFLWRTS